MTFKIELFCYDKHLANILKALADAGAYNVLPTPVILEGTGNGVAAAGVSSKVAVVYNHLIAAKADRFDSVQLRKAMKQAGINPASISYVREALVKARLVRHLGGRGKYQMINKGA